MANNRSFETLSDWLLKVEPEIITLMRGGVKGESLARVSDLNCASVTYLLAYLLNIENCVKDIFSLGGEGGCVTRHQGHEVLGAETIDGFGYLDGTVWQQFPHEQHMRIRGPFFSQRILIDTIANDYSGIWRVKQIPKYFFTPAGMNNSVRLIQLKAEQRNLG
jgi:hypothetical protein